MTKQVNTKKGFTIIEVVLVLAIAGLIFLMVFIALPALQRSQRDTQRGNDISRLITALNQYQANNRGAIPSVGDKVDGYLNVDKSKVTANNSNAWGYFYHNYLVVSSSGESGDFADPNGHPYGLQIHACSGSSNGDQCAKDASLNISFDNQLVGSTNSATGNQMRIHVFTNATCDGERPVYNTNQRKVAVFYKREGGGTICQTN